MADFLIYNESTGQGVQLVRSGHSPDFEGRTDAIKNPTLPETGGPRDWMVENGNLRAMTDAEKVAMSKANRAGQRIAEIKAKAGQVIVSHVPEWKQRNLTARHMELMDKEVVAGLGLSAEEEAEKDAIFAIWSWVKDVRAESDRLEADDSLFVEDAVWPSFDEATGGGA